MRRLVAATIGFAIVGCMAWQRASSGSSVVIYFGRPSEFVQYLGANWKELTQASSLCLFTALLSLALAGGLSVALLVIGLLVKDWLTPIEHLAASSQTIPLLVIVTVTLLAESAVFNLFSVTPWTWVYCVGPVTLALLFPPLLNGASAILRVPLEIKAILRIWKAPVWWRIRRVYLPSALPDILMGIRTSATWAIGATLITEGLLNGVQGDSETLGHFLVRPFSAGSRGRTPVVIIISTVLGFAVYYFFGLLQSHVERRLLGSEVGQEQAYTH